MWRLSWLWTAVMALTTSTSTAAAAGCAPALQLLGLRDGGRRARLTAPPPPCRCRPLQVQVCALADEPCGRGRLSAASHFRTVGDGQWRDLRYRRVRGGAEEVTLFLAGWYRPCCVGDSGCSSGSVGEPLWVDGLNMTTWNVSASVEQTASRLWMSVQVSQADAEAPPGFYLPKLDVTVLGRDYRKHKDVPCGPGGSDPVVFDGHRGADLAPGAYDVKVRPCDGYTFNCHGFSDGCPLWRFPAAIARQPEPTVRVHPASVVPLLVGVPVGIACLLAGAVCYACRRSRDRAAGGPPPVPLADEEAAGGVTVLLLHRGVTDASGAALRELQAALRAGGLEVLDVHGGVVRRLLHLYSDPAHLLASEPLRSARLLFVATAAARGARPLAEHVFDTFVRHVRNSRLGRDFGRVFVARLAGESAPELAGLVDGRRFVLPGDLPLLLRHLRAPPAAPAESPAVSTAVSTAVLSQCEVAPAALCGAAAS